MNHLADTSQCYSLLRVGISVANAIYKFLSENDPCDSIQVVGCNGTNVNSGHRKGVLL